MLKITKLLALILTLGGTARYVASNLIVFRDVHGIDMG